MNARRRLLLALAGSLFAPARAHLAEPASRRVRIGVLRAGSAPTHADAHITFSQTLSDLGWIEGRNLTFEYAYAHGAETRLPHAAAEIVARAPDLIYAQTGPEAVAAFARTRSIPIVFAAAVDPVEAGLVKSLAKPGGNVTGVATLGWQLGGKRMQLLKDAMPRIARVGVLMSSSERLEGREARNSNRERDLIAQAAGAGVTTIAALTKGAADLESVLAALAEARAEALLVCHNTTFFAARRRILDLAAKHAIAVVGHRSALADGGALMTYSSSLNDQIRRAAQLVDKILRGARPVDIPVEHPTVFELVVNLKTARALGIPIPPAILVQAERLIE